jgi:hypothetical protein
MRNVTFSERLNNTLQEDYGMYLEYFRDFQDVITYLANNYPEDDVEELIELIKSHQ